MRHLLVLVVLVVTAGRAHADEGSFQNVTEPPAHDQFLVIPLRIHLLSSTELPEVNCKVSEADIKRIVGKMNGIWHKAGIHWGLESLRKEPAARESRFRMARDLGGAGNLGLFRVLFPDES